MKPSQSRRLRLAEWVRRSAPRRLGVSLSRQPCGPRRVSVEPFTAAATRDQQSERALHHGRHHCAQTTASNERIRRQARTSSQFPDGQTQQSHRSLTGHVITDTLACISRLFRVLTRRARRCITCRLTSPRSVSEKGPPSSKTEAVTHVSPLPTPLRSAPDTRRGSGADPPLDARQEGVRLRHCWAVAPGNENF